VKTKTLDPKVIQHAAKVFRAVSHPVRLALVEALEKKKRSVGELAAALKQDQAVISKHLAVLKEAGVVTAETDFNFRFYSLKNIHILDVLNCIRKSCGEGS